MQSEQEKLSEVCLFMKNESNTVELDLFFFLEIVLIYATIVLTSYMCFLSS